MSARRDSPVPVPRMLAYCADSNVIGAGFYLMEYIDGRMFWNPLLPECSLRESAALYDAVNRTMASLHSISPATVGLESYGRPTGFMARQVRRRTEQYRASQTHIIPAMDELIRWLPEHLPPEPASARSRGVWLWNTPMRRSNGCPTRGRSASERAPREGGRFSAGGAADLPTQQHVARTRNTAFTRACSHSVR